MKFLILLKQTNISSSVTLFFQEHQKTDQPDMISRKMLQLHTRIKL